MEKIFTTQYLVNFKIKNMKNTLLIFALIISSFVGAQMKTGTIEYTITIDGTDGGEEQKQIEQMFAGSTMLLYFKPKLSAVEMKMGMFMNAVSIINVKKKTSLSLLDVMGQKIAIRDAKPEEKKKETVEKTTETKVIMGFNCTKYLVTDESNNVVTLWVTEEISINTEGQSLFRSDIKGTPLAFSTVQNGLKMNFDVSKIEKTVNNEKFSMKIPEGYTETTSEELSKQSEGK